MGNTPETKEYPWPERLQRKGKGSKTAKPIRYYIDANGCWVCVSHALSGGYPLLCVNRRLRKMHRHIWEREHGREVGKGLVVRHLCDNPTCINPVHLLIGTPADNRQDCVDRGRQARGSLCTQAKLTEKEVEYIYRNPRNLTQCELAENFGVDFTNISHIQCGRTWGWLTKGVK